MSGSSDNMATRADDPVEALLGQATPRPAPPGADEQRVRAAVRAEWQAVTAARSARQRVAYFAVAATVLLAVAVVFNQFRDTATTPLQLATISKSHGNVYLLGEQAELLELNDLKTISAGQTLLTGSGAGVGLDWGDGGSLRLDADTRIEFVAEDAAYLHSGRIYFDSQPGASEGSSERVAALAIKTGRGTVRHLGTQYMIYADADKLSVSVREGRVAIDGINYDETATAGQQLTLTGRGRPDVVNIKVYGEAWDWVGATAPATQFDGRSAHDFLRWVGRETGMQLHFEDQRAEQLAMDAMLRGTVDADPKDALRVWMLGVDLDWRMEGGVIYVSATDSSRGQ